MKYEYTPILDKSSSGRLKRRPLVEIELLSLGNSVQIQHALVDSGADECLFNIGYAKYLGINLNKCDRKAFIGIGNKPLNAYMTEVDIKVKYLEGKITVLVGFVDSNSVDALLGQEGFFDNHRIKFEKDHNTFEINCIKKKKK